MSKVTIMICDVCGRKIDSGEEYKSVTIIPRGGVKVVPRGNVRPTQRTCQICEDCFAKIGFQAEPEITLTGGKIGRVDK